MRRASVTRIGVLCHTDGPRSEEEPSASVPTRFPTAMTTSPPDAFVAILASAAPILTERNGAGNVLRTSPAAAAGVENVIDHRQTRAPGM